CINPCYTKKAYQEHQRCMKQPAREQNPGRRSNGYERKNVERIDHDDVPGGFILGLKTGRAGFPSTGGFGVPSAEGLGVPSAAGFGDAAAFSFWCASHSAFFSAISASVISAKE